MPLPERADHLRSVLMRLEPTIRRWNIRSPFKECASSVLTGRSTGIIGRSVNGLFALGVIIMILLITPQIAGAEADGPDYWQLVPSQNNIPVFSSIPDDIESEGEVSAGEGRSSGQETALEPLGFIPAFSTEIKNLGCQGGPTYSEWNAMTAQEREKARLNRWCKVEFTPMQRGREVIRNTDNSGSSLSSQNTSDSTGKMLSGWVRGIHLEEQNITYPTPSFDCSRTSGEVEDMICIDRGLIRLDRLMEDVYANSERVIRSLDDGSWQEQIDLKSTQRGWIRGRNDCWKADDIRTCVVRAYSRRISWLQAKWQLVKETAVKRYRCNDNAEVVITLYQKTVMPSAGVELGDKRAIFVASESDEGVTYSGSNGSYFTMRGDELSFLWDQFEPERMCTVTE